MRKKITIIGIDAADMNFIEKNIMKLPNFKRIIDKGRWGKLKSTIPPNTPPAWTSLSTGVNPGKHNIYGFRLYKNGFPTEELVKSYHVKSPRFWDLLARKNLSSLIVNFPVTFPPKIKNGLMVSGMLTTDKSRMSSDPTIKISNDYIIEEDWHFFSYKERDLFHKKVLKMIENRDTFFRKLKSRFKPDISICVFMGLDRASHLYCNDKDKILEIYKLFDKLLNKYIKNNENLMIVSDHGFSTVKASFYINTYLKNIYSKQYSLNIMSKILQNINELLIEVGLLRFTIYLPKSIQKKLVLIKKGKDFLKEDIFSDSMGYVCTKKSINIIKLSELQYKGIKVFSFIEKSSSLFTGEYIKNSPKYVFLLNNFLQKMEYSDNIFIKNNIQGTHNIYGIFMCFGPDFKKDGLEIKNITILDIAPTILNMFKFNIPNNIDGRIIKEIFEESKFKK